MKILVVDDDRTLADILAFTLRREGYEVILAHDGKIALVRWEEDQPDLVILDVNLPGVDGFEVCRRMREQSDIPILLLTVRGEEDDIVRGLKLGADDYITKPFSPRQLIARAQAVLRRAGQTAITPIRKVGELQLDLNRRELITGENQVIQLTALEGRLIDLFMTNVGRVLTVEMIIDHVWGPLGADRDMVRQLVHRLRGKIEPDPTDPIYIKNVPRLGYGLLMDDNIS